MFEYFRSILDGLINTRGKSPFSFLDLNEQFNMESRNDLDIYRMLNAAFLIALAGKDGSDTEGAKKFLQTMSESNEWKDIAQFYLNGICLIRNEISRTCKKDADFAQRLKGLADHISNGSDTADSEKIAETIWSVFFPEATGIQTDRQKQVDMLREKRIVSIKELNKEPITDPGRQILFTSNVLLTIPSKSIIETDKLDFRSNLKKKLQHVSDEEQIYFYDHPIQTGVEPEKNEVLYGLQGLAQAFEYEKKQGNMSMDTKPVCLLSVSVTHQGLHAIAKDYLEEELQRSGGIDSLSLYVFTESDTQRIVDEILIPAAGRYTRQADASLLGDIFGVDGEYGRHYSFLKAITALWNIIFQPDIRATFKIDLDQIFPQEELKKQTGSTMFEHFMSPLWGAQGHDPEGRPLELGMIAGALVNENDIGDSVFVPDVRFPGRALSADEYFFFSALPQALSTEAEMMSRYSSNGKLDGKNRCIQRIHVTGGTNGILIDSLRRYRPFTPTFMGRAEDQAYILSVLLNQEGPRLAYVHKDGLIMRHDKEAFAQEAIQSARIPKMVGDYVRIIYFSEYARALKEDFLEIKDIVDPFTGCFISKIPVSVVYLRFAFKVLTFFSSKRAEDGAEFIRIGVQRIADALKFTDGTDSNLKEQYNKERMGWNLYYDILDSLEQGLKYRDPFTIDLKKKAEDIIHQCRILTGKH